MDAIEIDSLETQLGQLETQLEKVTSTKQLRWNLDSNREIQEINIYKDFDKIPANIEI